MLISAVGSVGWGTYFRDAKATGSNMLVGILFPTNGVRTFTEAPAVQSSETAALQVTVRVLVGSKIVPSLMLLPSGST